MLSGVLVGRALFDGWRSHFAASWVLRPSDNDPLSLRGLPMGTIANSLELFCGDDVFL